MDNFPGKNLTAKILALIFAIVLWLYVTNEQNPAVDVTVQAPLEIKNLAAGYVTNDVAQTVRVKLRGPRNVIATLQAQDVKAYVDLSGVEEGKQSLKVSATPPHGLEIVDITPDKITLRVDKVISRQVPVELTFTGTSADGAAVARAVPEFTQAAVEGPRTAVNAVEKIVATVDITGKTGDFTVDVPLVALGQDYKAAEGVKANPAKVNVAVTLQQRSNKKTVDIKTVLSGEVAKGYVVKSVTTDPAQIEIQGDPKILDQIDFVYTDPVSLDGLDKDLTREVRLVALKDGVSAARTSTIIHVRVEKQ